MNCLPQHTLPILKQSVQFAEQYVSRALNEKFSGIFPAGVYKGFILRPSINPLEIEIAHDENWPNSVAIVERDGYSITIIMADAGQVLIPAQIGTYYICIEALYSVRQAGYQRIVVKKAQYIEKHHIVLGSVTITNLEETTVPFTEEAISFDEAMRCNPIGELGVKEEQEIEFIKNNQAHIYKHILTLSNRLLEVELEHAEGINEINVINITDGMTPSGYDLEKARIAPITFVKEGNKKVKNAAITMVIGEYTPKGEGKE